MGMQGCACCHRLGSNRTSGIIFEMGKLLLKKSIVLNAGSVLGGSSCAVLSVAFPAL